MLELLVGAGIGALGTVILLDEPKRETIRTNSTECWEKDELTWCFHDCLTKLEAEFFKPIDLTKILTRDEKIAQINNLNKEKLKILSETMFLIFMRKINKAKTTEPIVFNTLNLQHYFECHQQEMVKYDGGMSCDIAYSCRMLFRNNMEKITGYGYYPIITKKHTSDYTEYYKLSVYFYGE